MKRVLYIIFFVITIICFSGCNYKCSNDFVNSGVSLSIKDFNSSFCKQEKKAIYCSDIKSMKPSYLNINSINVQENNIKFYADIICEKNKFNLSCSGELFNGYKKQDGKKSVIGDFKGDNNTFKVLLFEVFDDTTVDNLLINSDLSGKPHLKLYLYDNLDKVYLFELELPKELAGLKIDNSRIADSSKDSFWFTEIAKPYEIKAIPTDEKMARFMGIPLGDGALPNKWVGSETFYSSFYVGGDNYECWSLPNGEFKASHRVTDNDKTWLSSFGVAEHVNVNGHLYQDGINVFRYKNVKLSIGGGDKTRFLDAIVGGQIEEETFFSSSLKKVGNSVYGYLSDEKLNKVSSGTTINQIRERINGMTPECGKTTFKGGSLIGEHVPAVAYKIGSNQSLYKSDSTDGHYIIFQVITQYEGSSDKPTYTNGLMITSWDVYYSDGSLVKKNDSKEHSFYYTCSTK